MNIGVVLYCQGANFLGARTELNTGRLLALDPGLDISTLDRLLGAWNNTCTGTGPSAEFNLGQRFRWLTAPTSTIVQAGPVHTGLAQDPANELDRLLIRLVRVKSVR